MLSHLDRILFPDRCEVIEVVPSQRYVYPIFKNGSSSLSVTAKKNNWRIRLNDQIKKIDSIDIILRDPYERLMSGINTFIQLTIRDNPVLDKDTVKWFALNYLHLDRHYFTQFSWILNLARYTCPYAQLRFLSMESITDICNLHHSPPGIEKISDSLKNKLIVVQNYEMYQRIDTIIFDCIGQSMTFNQLLQHIKNTDPSAYTYVIGYAQQILKPIYVLS